jgi:hypothetical protein
MNTIGGDIVWRMKATHGLPLDFILARLAKEELIPTWDQLFAAAKADGTNLQKLSRELQFFVRETYPKHIADEINRRLPLMATHKEH